MLGKLIKHEFRATSGFMALICGGLLGFALLTRLFIYLEGLIDAFALPMAVSMFFYVLLAAVSVVLVYVLTIRRFYTNVYGDEGYLTLTLPVRRWMITASKLIVGATWIIADIIVTLGSVCIVAFSSELTEAISEFLYYFPSIISYAEDYLHIPAAVMIIESVVILLIALAGSLLVFYASMSVGQLFTGHRLLGSVIGYIAITVVTRVITGIFTAIMGFSQSALSIFEDLMRNGIGLNGITSFNIQVDVILYMLLLLVIACGQFFITNLIMKRAVNLQ